MDTTSQIVARALHSDVDLTEHLQVMDWCMRHVDQFHLLDTRERHNQASHVQMEAAVLAGAICPRETSVDETPFVSAETAVSFAFAAMENAILSSYPVHDTDALNTRSLRHWANQHVPGFTDLNGQGRQRLMVPALELLAQRNAADVSIHTDDDDPEDTMVEPDVSSQNLMAKEMNDHEQTFASADIDKDWSLLPAMRTSRPYGPYRPDQEERLHEAEKKTENIRPGQDKFNQTVADIADKFPQHILAFDRPHAVWAWCVLNVPWFVTARERNRRKTSDAVVELLATKACGDGPNNRTRTDPPSQRGHATRVKDEKVGSHRANKGNKYKEMWCKKFYESPEEISKRFPRQSLNYSEITIVAAWCILHVNGFAESGTNPRRKLADDVRLILVTRHGPYKPLKT